MPPPAINRETAPYGFNLKIKNRFRKTFFEIIYLVRLNICCDIDTIGETRLSVGYLNDGACYQVENSELFDDFDSKERPLMLLREKFESLSLVERHP